MPGKYNISKILETFLYAFFLLSLLITSTLIGIGISLPLGTIILAYLFFKHAEKNQKEKRSLSATFFDGIQTTLLAMIVMFGITLNMRDALAFFTIFLLFALFRNVFDYYLGQRDEKKLGYLSESLLGGGVLAFTIISYLAIVPLLVTDGTDQCKEYPVIDNGIKFITTINDLKVRAYGDRPSGIQIFTKVYDNDNEILCNEGCDTNPQIKPDGNPNETAKHVQDTNFQLYIPNNLRKFSFAQMAAQRDLIPIIGSNYTLLRTCECKIDVDENKISCNNTFNIDPLANTWLFQFKT